MSELIGKEVAGFRILREIARGGMGIVFEAEQVRLGRIVALKMLHPTLTVDREFLRRFEREARTLARLNHENIVNVIDYFHKDGRYFLALEFVEGETLARRLRRCARRNRFFTVGEASAVVWQVAQALAYAHGRDIVHRDLKPDNIMLTPRGRAKVMDFGIARIVGGSKDTEAGARVGTPDYMAPEQLLGRSVDRRSDLFSLGLIYYEMLTGKRPFTQLHLLQADLSESPPALPWPEDTLPPESARVRPILEKLLALDPGRRYGSAVELIEDMRERLGGEILGDKIWTAPSVVPEQAVRQRAEAVGRLWARLTWLRPVIVALALLCFTVAVLAYHRWQQARLDEQRRKLEATMANFQAFIADSQGRVTEAESLFLRAIDVDPTVARYWRDLGDFYYKYDQPEKAARYYRKTLELDPSDRETARRLKAIESSSTPTRTVEQPP